MKASFAAVGAGLCLAVSGCKKSGERVPQDAPHPSTNTTSSLRSEATVPAPEGVADRIISLDRTAAAVRRLSQNQSENFKNTGAWLTQEHVDRYQHEVLNAVSLDILNRVHESKGDQGRALTKALNQAGYHLFFSLMSVDEQQYCGVTLFRLEAPSEPPLLTEIKRVMKMEAHPAKMRELKPVIASEYSESVYGSVGGDGHIYVDVRTLSLDEHAKERDPRAMLAGVFANELGHLKIDWAREKAIISSRLDHQVIEAYSDYCTLAVTPPGEILYAAMDVLANTTPRYTESRLCAARGINEFGRAHVPGFTDRQDEASATSFVNYCIAPQNAPRLATLKNSLLTAYREILQSKGIPSELF